MSVVQNIILTGITATSMAVGSQYLDKDYIEKLIIDAQTINNPVPYEEILGIKSASEIDEANIHYDADLSDMSKWDATTWLAKLLYTERVHPESDEELRWIAATVLNRCLMNNETVKDVCTNKKQYSGVLRPSNRNWRVKPSKRHFRVAREVILQYIDEVPKDLERAYFFCNADIVKKTNPKSWRWFKTLPVVKTFPVKGRGTHTFYGSKKLDEFLRDKDELSLTVEHLSWS